MLPLVPFTSPHALPEDGGPFLLGVPFESVEDFERIMGVLVSVASESGQMGHYLAGGMRAIHRGLHHINNPDALNWPPPPSGG